MSKVFNPKDYVIPDPNTNFFRSIIKKDFSDEAFCDSEFPADVTSIHKDNKVVPLGAKNVTQWLRPRQIAEFPAMFLDGSSTGDVVQGKLGDCWLLSALSILASRQEVLEHCIVSMPHDLRKGGKFSFRLFKEGEWKIIDIDDRIPCNALGKPVFAHCSDLSENWVPLFEKAYAKLMGSYAQLGSGVIGDALVDFTGGVSFSSKIQPSDADNDKLWLELKSRMEAGSYMVGVNSTDKEPQNGVGVIIEDSGIVSGHAYAVLSCTEVDGHKLIKIRNPWSYGEWKGAWSDTSNEWTPEILKKLNHVHADDGEFYMSYQDFCKHWCNMCVVRIFNDPLELWLKTNSGNKVGYCSMSFSRLKLEDSDRWTCSTRKGEWDSESAGGVFSGNTAKSRKNPQYLFELKADAEVVISLLQHDHRYWGDDKEENFPIGIHVLKHKGHYSEENPHESDRLFSCAGSDLICKKGYEYKREIAIEQKFSAGIYVIVPSTYHEDKFSKFTLRVFVKGQTPRLTSLPTESYGYSKVQVDGSWQIGKTAGGCMNYYRWTENTQYKLRVDSNSDTKICLGVQQQVREGTKPAHISFYVSKCDPKDENSVIYEINKAAENEKFVSDKEVSGSLMVEPNKNYIVIPCTFNADIEANFTLSATWRKDTYPDAKVHLSPILDVDKETITVTSSWSGERAGGSVNDLESWQKNPRFALKLSKDATVNILLCQTEKEQNKLSAIGFHIFEKNQKEPTFKHQSWNYFRVASSKIALKASTTYSIIPSTFYKNEEKPFILKIITQKGVVDSFKQEL